jgi:hypothetical protein
MSTHGRTVAVTLYESGTLDISQAAARAGLGEDDFVRCLRRHGVAVGGGRRGDDDRETGVAPTRAD